MREVTQAAVPFGRASGTCLRTANPSGPEVLLPSQQLPSALVLRFPVHASRVMKQHTPFSVKQKRVTSGDASPGPLARHSQSLRFASWGLTFTAQVLG